jgi:hypothetical protein
VIKSSYSTLYEDILKVLPQNSSPGDLAYRIKSNNFKQLEDSINLLKETVNSNIRDLQSGKNNSIRGRFKYIVEGKIRESVLLGMKPVTDQIVGGINGVFQLLPERLNCVVLSTSIISTSPQGPFKLLPPGTTCNYQLVLYIPYNTNYPSGTLFQIESIVIRTVVTEKTCMKGKITKKVTGINPKCPSGYKEK